MDESLSETPQERQEHLDGAGPSTESADSQLRVRWFLIPLTIVTLMVGGWWLLFRLLAGPPDPREMIEDLRHPSRESWQQAFALVELLRSPESAELRSDRAACQAIADILASSLESGPNDPETVKSQVFLCRALGEFHIADGLPILVRAAEPRTENVLQVRCAALESIAVLASHARWSESPESQRVVTTVLAATQETGDATSGLSSARLAATAAFACGVLGGEAAHQRLRELLLDPRLEVRYNAATGLARQGNPECIPVLLEMLTTAEHSALADNASDSERERVRDTLVRNAVRGTLQMVATHPRAQVSTLRDALRALLADSDLPVGLRMEVQAALADLDRAAVAEAQRGSL